MEVSMAVTDMDLEVRSKQMHRINLAVASAVTGIGVLLMISIALMPLGLAVFMIGLAWLGLAMYLGRADRNRRETHRAPGERREQT
jgi:putative exporter of polyketide antibiotics